MQSGKLNLNDDIGELGKNSCKKTPDIDWMMARIAEAVSHFLGCHVRTGRGGLHQPLRTAGGLLISIRTWTR
jgi:hypothetical protein